MRAGATTPTPRRHRDMTANNDTPAEGQESADIGREGYPLDHLTNEEIAEVMEREKQKMRQSVDDVNAALLNEERPLTDEKLEEVSVVAESLAALTRTLSVRVPPAHRAENRDDGTPK